MILAFCGCGLVIFILIYLLVGQLLNYYTKVYLTSNHKAPLGI